ncbi:MAG: hypothetical protein AAGJ18_21960 [Bacteroidota bacterium]
MEDFEGTWNILEIEDYEQSDLHAMGTPFLKIDKYGRGKFEFSYVMGRFDGQLKTRGGKRLVFKWEGVDGDHYDGGIGEIRLRDKDTIEGELSFEHVPESAFVAERRKE